MLHSFARVFALVGAPVLWLAIASIAQADTMTYNVISNPQPDIHNGSPYEVDISGTITVDNTGGSAIGTFDSSNDSDVSVLTDLTMSTTDPGAIPNPVTVSGSVPLTTAFNIVGSSQLFATATSLSLGSNTYFDLNTGGGMLGANYLQVLYDTHDNNYNGAAGEQGPPESMQFLNSNPNGQYLVGGQWEIAAAVPEPGTLTLLGSALLGVSAISLRRRRATVA